MKKTPMRMCIACREMHPKKDLIRVVGNKEGEVLVDLGGKKPGKGAYLCRKKECVEKARKISALDRALGKNIPESIYVELEKNAE